MPRPRLRAAARLGLAPLCRVLAIAVVVTGLAVPARAQVVREDFYITNGTVNAAVLIGDTLVIGGSFSQVGPVTGAGVPIDSVTADPVSGFPKVTGQVNAVVPDGSGGWYIGGTFTSVGGLARSNLAHIRADNTVSTWNPGVNNTVRALVLSGSTLYAGGAFTLAGGQVRSRIAAIDTATALATAWNPNSNNTVLALLSEGSTVYAAGSFTVIGGQTRNRIAAIDSASGFATAWDPNANSQVSALARGNGILYAGGSFTNIGGQSRNRIAALDSATALATAWNPSSNGQVLALSVNGGSLFAGGQFTSIGGFARNRLAELSEATGLAMIWNPNANGTVQSVMRRGATLYAGGEFTTIGGQPRSRIAALDVSSGLASAWNPNAYSTVFTLATHNAIVFVGGAFTGLGGELRNNLAAINTLTGMPTGWDPNADSMVLALATDGTVFYAAGDFSTIGGQGRSRIAALDWTTALSTAWNPNIDGQVSALAVRDNLVYAGGSFTNVGGQPRNNLAAIDAASGLATAWNPGTDGQVFTLAAAGNVVYVGGLFANADGLTRNNLAAIDATTGLATAWNPNPNGTVRALALSCGTVYTGGFFTNIGGAPRMSIAALSASTGLASGWNPAANGPIFGLRQSGRTVYVGGIFSTIGGQSRNRIAALSTTTGLATPWNPNAGSTVRDLAVGSGHVYAVGSFATMGGLSQANLAAISADLTLACPTITLSAPGPNGRSGIAYSHTISASGGTAPYCLALTAGALPPGLSFNPSTGLLSGTPGATGTFGFTIRATDATGCSASLGYSLLILPPCPAITLAPPTLVAGRVGVAYAQALTPSAGTAPFVFTLASGALPAGLTLSGAGLIAGMPTAFGPFAFTVNVSDSTLCIGSQAFSLLIRPACGAIAITPAVLPDATIGVAYAQSMSAIGGTAPRTWAVVAGALPVGLALDSLSGALSGTPTTGGTSNFTIAVTDSNLCVASRSYTVETFSAAPLSSVAAHTAGISISTANPCAQVPVVFTRGEATPLRAVSVTFQIDTSRLALCTPAWPESSIHIGTWLAGFANHNFQVINNGGGSFTVDQAILGEPCGESAGGPLFTVDLASTNGDGGGLITITAVHARDCSNVAVAAGNGPPAALTVCNNPIALSPAVLPDGTLGVAYSQTLTPGSGTAPFTWAIESGSLPAGLLLGSGSGTLSGTPGATGTSTFAISATDTNGCSGTRSYTVTIFGAPPLSSVAANTAGLCIAPLTPCISVPVIFTRTESAPLRALSVTFQIDASRLALCSAPAVSIQSASWLSGFATTSFQVLDNGAGSYTVDLAILGEPCGATGGGQLFSINLAAAGGDGVGSITITAVKARDCTNGGVAAGAGPVASLTVNSSVPATISDLAAAPVVTGNGTGSTTRIAITWSTGAAGTVHLYRAPFGVHPEYDAAGPITAPDPATIPAAPWVLVSANAASGIVDSVGTRGFWHYAARIINPCGTPSLASNMTGGTLNYVLGDVSDGATAGLGNNVVGTPDVSLLGAHYGIGAVDIAARGVQYLDLGPTVGGFLNGRPTPDRDIDFDDLMIFAGNYGTIASAPLLAARAPRREVAAPAATTTHDEFRVDPPARVAPGEPIAVTLWLKGSGRIQGFSAQLAWDAAVVEPIGVEAGERISEQNGVTLSPHPGAVDAALLGTRELGMSGEGAVARITFRVLAAGDPAIRLASVAARDAANQPLTSTVDVPAALPALPTEVALLAPTPNPFRSQSTLGFALPQAGPVDLAIYGVDGRRVRTLARGTQAAGRHVLAWDGRDDQQRTLAPGVFYLRLEAGGREFTRRLVYLK